MAYIGQSLTEGTRREYSYVATASQTTFNAIYTVGAVDVYQNGVLLAPSDYTATTGTTVVFNTGAALNDEITIHCHNTFSVADTVSASQGGTFNQPLTVEGDGATVLTVDRATSEGTLVDFKKDGITVGNLGVGLSSLSVGTGNTQLLFWNSQSGIFPSNGATVTDNSIDFGNPNYRFKDLYLSGGVYLGGTGAANLLDDYEEGEWWPTIYGLSGGSLTMVQNSPGKYVKIGRSVHVSCFDLQWTANSGLSGNVILGGLPFSSDYNRYNDGIFAGSGSGLSINGILMGGVDPNANFAWIMVRSTTNGTYSHTPTFGSSGIIYGFSLTYQTAA